jgi:uncharacterized membrane protein YphA (DoxX/SURF4 family)
MRLAGRWSPGGRRVAGELTDFRRIPGARQTAFGPGFALGRPDRFEVDSTKVLSGARILFGAIFLFDGILKWDLFATGQMQGVVQSFGVPALSTHWLLFGALVGVGETAAGAALVVGLFQRPAAIVATVVMGLIWAFGNLAATGNYGGFSAGYTDPGGDLMLALTFAVLVFAPCAYGLASRYHLRGRFDGSSWTRKFVRFVLT